MGSMIHLAVGRLEIDWGKNHGFVDHSPLFQESDVGNVPYFYVEDHGDQVICEFKEGMTKPLADVLDRIALLGYTRAACEAEFNFLSELNDFDRERFSFDRLRSALSKVDVLSVSEDYGMGGLDFGKFFRREIAPRLELGDLPPGVEHAMENLSPYVILHLLADNPAAKELPVNWAFKDVEEGGWARRAEFVRPLDRTRKFLIVTEGSSDAAILKHALKLLMPHIADFFEFVDMDEGYPFSGTGNLYRFVQGLVSIGILNNVVVLFDNDAEGVAGYKRCSELNLPSNMRVLKLPDLPDFADFPTIGPDGRHRADINGKGVAIECYLDLGADACVRWNNFNAAVDAYQGELIGKDRYKKRFLDQREPVADYEYSRIKAVLSMIVETCVSMREAEVVAEMESNVAAEV